MSRSVVAQGSVTLVERCDCGSVYLSVGPVCLKLHTDALVELRETLVRATRALEAERRVKRFGGSRTGECAAPAGEGVGADDRVQDGEDPTCDPN